MLELPRRKPPPDQAQRDQALDPHRSILVRAPAGSGKTTLLVERFLRLLAEVDEPGQIVAITFTRAAAAEMRNRILDELRNDQPGPLARQALEHSRLRGWNLPDLPAQMRISTIDSFCRDLALQRPLLSGLGGSLEISERPIELYRRAARRTLEQLGNKNAELGTAVETLLLWRDNNWRELENLVVQMLANRDRWMRDFVLGQEQAWEQLRDQLESAFSRVPKTDSSSVRYSQEEWTIVQACFTLLRRAAGELKVVFADTPAADFIEIAQIAMEVLKGEDDMPSEGALGLVDGIRHLLVDEFQDTSRRQHEFLARLIAAWPERAGRTVFVVGDPLQSIYGFRDADAELFPRVEKLGLEIPGDLPLRFDPLQLTANFRSAERLVEHINQTFARIYAEDDGSGLVYTEVEAARAVTISTGPQPVTERAPCVHLHVDFMPETLRIDARGFTAALKEKNEAQREAAHEKQIETILAVIRGYLPRIEEARKKDAKYRVAVLGRKRTALASVAQALRDAGIPFRAVKLENLDERPEILDAVALARALLNPEDRVAWLGILRAPWCGLSLADLHALASADNAEILARPVPQLMTERAPFLSDVARAAVERVLRAAEFARHLRAAQPAAATGTWLEQVWLQLGGADCVDATERANLDLFWRALDRLPQGETDLLGSALDAALEDLKAQPDPAAGSDCGVQLMTIHEAKGLEFEVVLVPELEAGAGRSELQLLSWLERGVAPGNEGGDQDDTGPITEFLVAPLQSKGAERGRAKESIDRLRRDRERQELRRLFYVAATRAREELHLFARPSYKIGHDGLYSLVPPRESLLKIAWPALKDQIEREFAAWRAATAAAEPLIVQSIAASEDAGVLEMPRAPKPTPMRRLPAGFAASPAKPTGAAAEAPLAGVGSLYQRHEGGLPVRLLGRAVHQLLEELAQVRAARTDEASRTALARVMPRIAAEIRTAGVEPSQADRIAEQALQIVLEAANDPQAQWILAPHAGAANEIRWTGILDGSLRTVQVDRVFRAGATPGALANSNSESGTWWIIDYKTTQEGGLDPAAALPQLRAIFAPQVEAYGKILRNLHGVDVRVCGGLYYPRMAQFDWWQL